MINSLKDFLNYTFAAVVNYFPKKYGTRKLNFKKKGRFFFSSIWII